MTTDNLLAWQANGLEANKYLITKPSRFGRDWLASVQFNGEMSVMAQTVMVGKMVNVLNHQHLGTSGLSERIRAGVEAAPWVIDEVCRLEKALHEISLCSQNSSSSKEHCGYIARQALLPRSEADHG